MCSACDAETVEASEVVKELRVEVATLVAANERLKCRWPIRANLLQTLNYYASKTTYVSVHHELSGRNGEAPIEDDKGERARTILRLMGYTT